MRRSSPSARSAEVPAALSAVYERKRLRTIELVRAAVDSLVLEQRPISYTTITARSRVLDADGKGVSQSAVERNTEARAYYELHRTAARSRTAHILASPRQDAPAISTGRDVSRARVRYRLQTKDELIMRLLSTQDALARNAICACVVGIARLWMQVAAAALQRA